MREERIGTRRDGISRSRYIFFSSRGHDFRAPLEPVFFLSTQFAYAIMQRGRDRTTVENSVTNGARQTMRFICVCAYAHTRIHANYAYRGHHARSDERAVELKCISLGDTSALGLRLRRGHVIAIT